MVYQLTKWVKIIQYLVCKEWDGHWWLILKCKGING